MFLKLAVSGMAIASKVASHPTFFSEKYRIKTTKKIASVIALQNLPKKICDFSDYFDFLSLILLVSFVW